MALRITKVDEYQFLTCFKYGLWGANKSRFKNWNIGDYLIFIVDKKITALAEIASKPFISNDIIWDNGTFPHRIKIVFKQVFLPENRIPVLGKIRDTLTNAWGANYGWGILNQEVLPEDASCLLIEEIQHQHNDIYEYKKKLDIFIENARIRRQNELDNKKPGIQKKKGRKKKNATPEQDVTTNTVIDNSELKGEGVGAEVCNNEEESCHLKAQQLLIDMGNITGCSVWIAANDRNRLFKGQPLGKNCIERLPNFGLNKEATSKISLIDIIWIQQNSPLCAFEVETTTSIYSGLLRMSDLISLVPALKINLYIVAPMERKDKVMKELRRPTFQKIGLNEYCKFIAIEDLEKLIGKIKELYGHIHPSVVENIAFEAEVESEE